MDEFDEIFDFYNRKDQTEDSIKLWCDKFLKRQMDELLNDSNNLQTENCIILILNLFFIKTPDHYHCKGKEISDLTKSERRQINKILSNEINNKKNN